MENKKELTNWQFYGTPLGKIASVLAHDHANATCGLGGWLHFMKKSIENDNFNKDKFLEAINGISKCLDGCKSAIDYTYIQLKNIEEINAGK